MGDQTGIGWTDATFNPVWGCTKIASTHPNGSACDGCYAEAWARRFGVVWGPHGTFREFGDAHWAGPLKWDAAAERAGVRRRVFCASMADVFDNRWPDGVRDRLWRLIQATPHLDWQLLTKRPSNIAKMLPSGWGAGWANVWLGCTVENQIEADRRIPRLLAVPAALHFLSCEPLLAPVDLTRVLLHEGDNDPALVHVAGIKRIRLVVDTLRGARSLSWRGIGWVIAGGESGARARPSNPQWFRDLRDQCAAAGVPFFFKQWGDLLPVGPVDRGTATDPTEYAWQRVGTKAAGNLLDGRKHEAFPVVAHA